MGKFEKGKDLTEKVSEAIEELQEQLALGHSDEFVQSLKFYAQFHRYSFSNAWLIRYQRPTATLVAGFHRWKKIGFTVRKGEQGIAILAPIIEKQEDPDTGEVTKKVKSFRVAYVFDITQTVEYPEKQPPAQWSSPVPEGDLKSLYVHLCDRVRATGIVLSERELRDGSMGNYSLTTREIVINALAEVHQKATCVIHEYCHSVAHPTMEEARQWTEQEREWLAESVSFTVCHAIGVENLAARDYLLHWKLTTDKLGDIVTLIQKFTKRVIQDLRLKVEEPEETTAIAAD